MQGLDIMSIVDIDIPFEMGFQRHIDFNNKKYCFKHEYNDSGHRICYVCDNRREFLNCIRTLPENNRTFYELIRRDDTVAEYYDIDYKVDNWDIDRCNTKSVEIIDSLLDTRNNIYRHTLSKKDIIVLSAHTPYKISLHVISKKTFFKTNRMQNICAKDIYYEMKAIGNEYNIDASVYKNNQCFRMFKNHKYGKNNTLVLFKPELYSYCQMEDTCVVLDDTSGRQEIMPYDEKDLIIRNASHNPREKLSYDLEKKLLEFLDDYPYLELDGCRINRIDGVTRKCLCSNDEHSKENMYWFINNHSLLIKCFCGKGRPIFIARKDGINRIDMEPVKFLHTTHYSEDVKSFDEFGSFTTIIDTTRTGGGKTTRAMRMSETYERVLVIHHRLSLDDDYIAKYPDFISYNEGVNNSKQTVCFNSLYKIKDICNYDLIIFDEFRSILRQTLMKDTAEDTAIMFGILENVSKPLIILDANITNEDIDFINHIRGGQKYIIHNREINNDKNVYFLESEEVLLDKILRTIEQENKVVIPYNISVTRMDGLLEPLQESYKILHINKFTRKDIRINDEEFQHYDIIAFSPTISEGVSIEDDFFEHVDVYGLFTSTSCPAESVSQMLARFRKVVNLYVYVNDDKHKSIPYFNCKTDVINYYIDNVNEMTRYSKGHINFRRRGMKLDIIQDEFYDLFAKNMIEMSKDYHNYVQTLQQKLRNNGYNLFYMVEPDDDIQQIESRVKEYTDKCKIEQDKRITESILNANDISFDQYKTIKDIGCNSYDEKYQTERYELLQSINMKGEYLTIELVETFRQKDKQMKLRNIRKCFEIQCIGAEYKRISLDHIINNIVYNDIRGIESATDFQTQQKYIHSKFGTKLGVLNEWAIRLGFEYITDPNPITVDIYNYNLNQLITEYKSDYVKYRKIQQVFMESYKIQAWEDLDEKFIMSKMNKILALKFNTDKVNHKVYQQISLPVVFYCNEKNIPSIIYGNIYDEHFIRKYDIMFMALTKHCAVCDTNRKKPRKRGLNISHYSSDTHLKNMKQQGIPVIQVDDPPVGIQLTCSVENCDFTTTTRNLMIQHMNSGIHDDYYCDTCQQRFYNPIHFERHITLNRHRVPYRLLD